MDKGSKSIHLLLQQSLDSENSVIIGEVVPERRPTCGPLADGKKANVWAAGRWKGAEQGESPSFSAQPL